MSRVAILVLLGLGLLAAGCETGSTHENSTDTGAGGQNTGQSGTTSGPVPGSETGTTGAAQAPPAQAPAK